MTNQPTPRPLHELLGLLLENMDRMMYGLCQLNTSLWLDGIITSDELDLVDGFLYSNCKPIGKDGFGYLFPRGEIAPRKQWLKEQIQKVKSNG